MNPIQNFLESLPSERKEAFEELRKTILEHLPSGFSEVYQNNMLHYVVPFELYPQGYHCDSTTPLPFISLASQKNYIALYHLGIYAQKDLLDWFTAEYPKYDKNKLDMGKSCIRFKKVNQIPYSLIAELAQKMTSQDWIKLYENTFLKK